MLLTGHKTHTSAGFTLIELVIVMILLGILAAVLVTVMRGPVIASIDVQRRMLLVDIAETALQRMTREIRLALPNSIRVSLSGDTVEFLRTVDGGRYRAKPPPGNRRLIIPGGGETGTFDVLGGLTDANTPAVCGASCLMVVYNTGQTGANAYTLTDNTATITAFGAGTITYARPGGSGGFPIASPQQRFQIIDTPVMYQCSGGQIQRYSGYAIQAAMPSPGGGNLLIDRVTSCNFTYNPGSLERAALLTIRITVTHPDIGSGGQSITLLQQVHVNNQP
jgi:MSHA biogenesis protein MshO